MAAHFVVYYMFIFTHSQVLYVTQRRCNSALAADKVVYLPFNFNNNISSAVGHNDDRSDDDDDHTAACNRVLCLTSYAAVFRAAKTNRIALQFAASTFD